MYHEKRLFWMGADLAGWFSGVFDSGIRLLHPRHDPVSF
jgi:hypothetical protein